MKRYIAIMAIPFLALLGGALSSAAELGEEPVTQPAIVDTAEGLETHDLSTSEEVIEAANETTEEGLLDWVNNFVTAFKDKYHSLMESDEVDTQEE